MSQVSYHAMVKRARRRRIWRQVRPIIVLIVMAGALAFLFGVAGRG